MATNRQVSFFAQHEFLIRRLHSLSGLIPVGAFMVVHLIVNSSLLSGASTFQKNVYQIHSLEEALVFVEWAFIFLPLLFHGIFGLIIIKGGFPNQLAYPYTANIRYVLQRASGIVALFFILYHVFHMHGWFHFDAWMTYVAEPLGGANFRPFNAASTLGLAMSNPIVQILYAIGIAACVFHLANGLWTMGITWGVWTSPAAQARATKLSAGLGVLLLAVGFAALYATTTVDVPKAREVERGMLESKLQAGEIKDNEHKRSPEIAPAGEAAATPDALNGGKV